VAYYALPPIGRSILMKRGAARFSLVCAMVLAATQAFGQGVYTRANWLHGVKQTLYADVQSEFKTRYDGSIWAKACRKPALAKRLGPNRRELQAFVFERLDGHKDAKKVAPLEKWMLVHGVGDMVNSYLKGGRAFVRAGRKDCSIVLRGLRREFPE